MDTARWMSNLHGDLRLDQIVMPGSHDAGVYGVGEMTAKSSALSWAKCQYSNFGGQAEAGSRFFDLRVFVQKIEEKKTILGKLPARAELRAGHFMSEGSSKKEPTGGAFGGSLVNILKDSCGFVEAHPTEFLILRYSHIKNPDLVVQAIRFFITNMGPRRDLIYINGNGGNLAALPIKSLRKKVIMVFDEKAFPAHITPGEGIHRFKKHPASGVAKLPSGLCTCGEFSASAIFGKMSMSAVRKQAEGSLAAHKSHGNTVPHLHFIYWQQTAGALTWKNVEQTTTAKGGAHAKLPQFTQQMFGEGLASDGRPPVNIVSHDFVTTETCTEIIGLNPAYSRDTSLQSQRGWTP